MTCRACRVEAKQHAGDGAGNGSSGNNDNSASKNGAHNNGSNGNGASTSLAEQNALLNTAEGKPPPNTEPLKVTGEAEGTPQAAVVQGIRLRLAGTVMCSMLLWRHKV